MEGNDIDRSIPLSQISLGMKRIRRSKLSGPKKDKALQRMGFIHLRYKDFSIEEAASITGITLQTGYNWQREWNRHHMDFIVPRYNGGRSSLLTDQQKEELIGAALERPPTTREVRDMIQDMFGISYSEKQAHVIMGSLGFRHVSMKPPKGSLDSRRRMRWIK